jgi:serine/threonine-protein kinase
LSVAIQHVNTEPPPLKQQRPDLPEIVCGVIHRMMEKNPDDRYQDAQTLLVDLNRIAEVHRTNPAGLAKLRLTESAVAGLGPAWLRPFLGWSLRRHVVAFTASAASVAAVAAAIGWWHQPVDPFKTEPKVEVSTVPIKETATLQYLRAMEINDEASWLAVLNNFYKDRQDPHHRRMRLRAKESLAMVYIRTERYADAEKIYRSFTIEDDNDHTLKAKGYAGLAALAFRKGNHRDSQKIIVDRGLLTGGRLENTELGRLIKKIDERNREILNHGRTKILTEPKG